MIGGLEGVWCSYDFYPTLSITQRSSSLHGKVAAVPSHPLLFQGCGIPSSRPPGPFLLPSSSSQGCCTMLSSDNRATCRGKLHVEPCDVLQSHLSFCMAHKCTPVVLVQFPNKRALKEVSSPRTPGARCGIAECRTRIAFERSRWNTRACRLNGLGSATGQEASCLQASNKVRNVLAALCTTTVNCDVLPLLLLQTLSCTR